MSAPLDAAIRAVRRAVDFSPLDLDECAELFAIMAIRAFIENPHLSISWECRETLRAHLGEG